MLESLDRCVFVVCTPWSFEKAQQKHSRSSLLTDAQTNGAQHHSESCLTFALAFTVVDMELPEAALTAIRSGHDADVTFAATS